MLGRLFRNSSNYAIGSLLVTLAGIISFPLFTRTFSVAEYGTLNLISSVLLLWAGIGKLGIQQSIVRFHAEVSAGNRQITESEYLSTVLIGMACTGAAATTALAITSALVPASWWNNDQIARLMLPLSLLIIVRVLDSGINNILRAQERSFFYSVYSVLRKYATLAIILAIMFYFVPRLDGFYLGTFIAELGAVLFMLVYLCRKYDVTVNKFSSDTFKRMVAFGMPLIVLEASAIILNLGDRYVIQVKLGAEALGQYSAAYNLCEYLQTVLIVSFNQAVAPMYLKIWEAKGEDETRRFMEQALRFYLLVAMAVFAGMVAVGQESLTFLASDKYSKGGVVIPFVVAGFLIDGLVVILGAGIFIRKQNKLLIPVIVAAAVINVLLNIALLPIFGIVGAGAATLICYVLVSGFAWHLGAKRFKVKFPVLDACKFAALATIMYAVVQYIYVEPPILDLLAKVLTGTVVYALLVVAFDKQTRDLLLQLKSRRQGLQ